MLYYSSRRRRKMRAAILTCLLLLTCACHRDKPARMMFDVAEPPPPAVMAENVPSREQDARQATVDDPATLPQIAYTYTVAYSVGAAAMADVQRRHVALCDSLGPARCRIVSMHRDSSDEGASNA